MFPKQTRILIADDMPAERELLRSLLVELGFTSIVETTNGAEAFLHLEVACIANEEIELVITDWNMPEMNGLELLQKIRGEPRVAKVPTLMLTSIGESGQVIHAIKAGVSDYIVKPVTKDTLERKLATVWVKVGKKA